MATRILHKLEILCDSDTGAARLVRVTAGINMTDGLITSKVPRHYEAEISDLSSGAQTRIVDLVSDVVTFMNNREPLS
jgi:hypothetical protein